MIRFGGLREVKISDRFDFEPVFITQMYSPISQLSLLYHQSDHEQDVHLTVQQANGGVRTRKWTTVLELQITPNRNHELPTCYSELKNHLVTELDNCIQ